MAASALFMLFTAVQAQFTYTFTATTGTYTNIAVGTSLTSIQADDVHSVAIPLGFDFGYGGVQVSDVRVNSNGWISMETGDSPSATEGRTNSIGAPPSSVRPAIAPLWDDLHGTGGTAKYETTGSAPNRVFTMEWRSWRWDWNGTAATISMQCKLYETTNVVEFIYRQEAGSVNNGSGGASIGLMSATSGTYYSLNGTGASPTASTSTATNNLSTRPATNQLYRFTPSCGTPASISSTTSNSPICTGTTLNLSTTASGTAPLFYAWTGTGTFSDATISNPTVTGAATGTYSVVVRNWCGSTANGNTSVTVTAQPTTANAGPAQTICNTTSSVTLAANTPGVGTAAWSVVSGPSTSGSQFSSITSPSATFTPASGAGTYTLRWTISNSPCTASTSNVVITVNAPPATANAGPDQTICATGSGTLAANSASPGTGAWTVLAGSPSTVSSQFSSTSSATATFTPAGGAGNYTLRWTTSNSPCASFTDDVVITATPGTTTSNAGPDQSFCLSSIFTNLAANTPVNGTGAWSILAGSPNTSTAQLSDAASATATFTPTASGTYTLRWTISNSPCAASTNDVVITVLPFASPVSQTFNANGTFTVPAGVTQITVLAWGGGAAGGGSTSTGNSFVGRGGAGGGGGAFVSKNLTVTPGSTLSIQVAAAVAGSSGANGGNGNPSTITGFEPLVFAAGGSGGAGNLTGNTPAGGAGGTTAASEGDVQTAGSNGGNGATGLGISSGAGGAGASSGGAGGAGLGSGTSNGNGGAAPGGGGGGGRTSGNNGNTAGGSGAAGRVIITYTPVPGLSASATTICQGSSTILTASGGSSYSWSPGGATTPSITVSPSATLTYSVKITNTCPTLLTQQISVIQPVSAGSNGSFTVCSIDAASSLFSQLGGSPNGGGSWSGPSTVSGGMYDPATMDPGVYTYLVTGTSPCPNESATVTVTENTATTWYADADNDNAGDPGVSLVDCTQPTGYVSNSNDQCPSDQNKVAPGQCGCGVADTDTDGDLTADCNDLCPLDPNKITPGTCGCGVADTDTDGDSVADCLDVCPNDPDNDLDGDGICGDVDNCPNTFGQVGSPCNDGNVFTTGDVLQLDCSCAGTPVPCDNWTLKFNTDGAGSQTSWTIYEAGTANLLAAGGPYLNFTTYTETICVPTGLCWDMTVNDAGCNGINPGGWLLKDNNGMTVIDNVGNGAGFTCSAGINAPFCSAMGTDQLTFNTCDREDLVPTSVIVASENPAVTAQYGVNNANSGYQFWIFDPNGGYSLRKFISHAAGGAGTPGPTSCNHLKLSSIGGNNTVPQNILLNVRVRSKVNGVYAAFGKACRMRIDLATAACPTTQLDNIPQHIGTTYSCGATGVDLDGSDKIWALPAVKQPGNVPAHRYRFQFELLGEGYLKTIQQTSYAHTLVTWPVNPLEYGKTYTVRVQASFNGGATWCAWGPDCTINTSLVPPGAAGQRDVVQRNSQLHIFPNPNRGDQLYLSTTELGADALTATVDLFDLFGRRVMSRVLPVGDGELNAIIDLDHGLASGPYQVIVTAGDVTFNERLVIE